MWHGATAQTGQSLLVARCTLERFERREDTASLEGCGGECAVYAGENKYQTLPPLTFATVCIAMHWIATSKRPHFWSAELDQNRRSSFRCHCRRSTTQASQGRFRRRTMVRLPDCGDTESTGWLRAHVQSLRSAYRQEAPLAWGP